MKKRPVPVNKTTGKADVRERLAALDASQRSAVLATVGGGRPYTSLVSFALTPDKTGVLFATPRATTKYKNIRENPNVSMLIDSRTNTARDIMAAEVVTIIGTARPVRRGKRHEELACALKAKHPELAGFVEAKTTALVLVETAKAVHVTAFQEVSVWVPGRPLPPRT